jgi:hypothetical protein
MKNKMVVRLAKDLEDGRALILDQAHVEEFENYAMEMTEKGRITYGAPSGEHDDVVSAKMLQHHGLVTEGAPDFNVLTGHSVEPPQPNGANDPDNRDNDEDHDDPNDWSDLVDEGAADFDFLHEEPVKEARVAGVVPPTPEELLARDAVWSR